MIKACIFDLDGTLTNTLDSLEYSVNETMKEIGMPQITKEQCRQFVGDGAKVLLERTLKAGGDTQLCHLEEAVEAYARIFDANCMYKVAPYEGIPQMLQQLKESGIKLAVLSNKPDRQAVHVVEEVFGKEFFDHIQGQKDGVPKKPDPTAALTIVSSFGVLPEEAAYIGDSEVDLATGHAAKMQTILVSWGFRGRKALLEAAEAFLEDCMAVVVESLAEVREYFEENGMDVDGMSEEELEEASEVFALPDGTYLIVEG